MPKPPKRPETAVDLFAPLHHAGVTREVLDWVILEAERRGRDQTDELHPSGYGGQRAHAEATHGLRVRLPPPWAKADVEGQARVTHEELRVSIVVMSGDGRTGREGYPQARAKNEKGGVTMRSVGVNEQLLLSAEFAPTVELRNRATDANTQVWVLLFNRERGRNGEPDVVRYEVSLPVMFDAEAKNITNWAHREIFPPIVLDTPPSMDGGGSGPEPSANDGGDDDTLDIPVRRRK